MAAATSTKASSSSLSLPQWRYDVFLSFKGEDTRKNFTDHLYAALCHKGIRTFRDEEKLERGKSIKPELLKAIEESRFAVIIFSKNYASSMWCLDELVKIVECRKNKNMIVFPVFYHVAPSDIRYQRGSFALVFPEHVEVFKMQRWRHALREVADLSGWHLHDSYESIVVRNIVGEILHQLHSSCSSVSKNLVGITTRAKEMMNLCKDLMVDDVCFFGIYGMGGIGKTTLAHAVYRRISCQFDASVFLENVKEETKIFGLVALQKKLFSKILEEREIEIKDVEEGADMIQKRLHGKKVLIILDDVDKLEQLHALAQTSDWFGGGSKIIITTRNKRLLIEHDVGVDEIYKVKELNYSEALQLFSWKAFKEDHPPETFMELSKEFLNYANGHPLALEVLGSSLYRRSVDLWKSMLSKVKNTFDEKILGTLRASFDELSEVEKKVFLDIACFFKREEKDRASDILGSYLYDPNIILDDLISKSLITIEGNKLWLHELLEDMGQKIVYSEAPEEPGLRSRLWINEDIHHVLKNNTGSDRVEVIFLKSTLEEELHLNPEAFSKVRNIRLLKICNVNLSQGLSHLPNKLWLMEWFGYPLKSLLESFTPLNLVELIMPCSYIQSIWKGKKSLHKLKILDLRDSQNLIKTPDFMELPNLEKLILQGCVKLLKVHPSIGNLKRLILLNLRDCKSLDGLPCKIGLGSLQILILSGCSKINKFPEIVRTMNNLLELHLDGTAIKKLPLSMEHLTSLTLLNLENCKGLIVSRSSSSILDKIPMEHLPELDIRGIELRQAGLRGFDWLPPISLFFGWSSPPNRDVGSVLPTVFSRFCSLRELNLGYCNLSHEAFFYDLSRMSSLQLLKLSGNKFEYMPKSISKLTKLKCVYLDNCSRLRCLPKFAPSVQFVSCHYCASLERNMNNIDIVVHDERGVYVLKGTSSGIQAYRFQDRDTQSWLQVAIDLGRIAYRSLSRDGMPMLYNNLSKGFFVKLQLNLDSNNRSEWLGYALYFEFEVRGHGSGTLAHVEDSLHIHIGAPDKFVFDFDTDEGRLKQPLILNNTKVVIGLYRFCVYIPRIWFVERSYDVDKFSFIKASITSSCPATEVQMCGAHLIYKQNAQRFVQICGAYRFGLRVWT